MSEPINIPKARPKPAGFQSETGTPALGNNNTPPELDYFSSSMESSNHLSSPGFLSSTPSTPGLRRTSSSMTLNEDDEDSFPPLDRLTMFDILENLALPQRLERFASSISAQTDKVRRRQQKLASGLSSTGNKAVEEWRKRIPTADEQLDKYRKRMRESVDSLNSRWSDARTVTAKEKVSFIAGVLNIFISGYLIGAAPETFHYWYTAQLCYFMPIRWYTYHKIGYHYFLADLCYFVNLLLVLCIWFFPSSERLFISTFCLAFGNNAIAIAMWRNSLVFHSLDKVTSLFIHIMPCVTLHCMVHLMSPQVLLATFPAIHNIKFSSPDSPDHYTLSAMVIWATVPYAVWQLSYHLMITVRRREKIAAGRPTSFTWLRKSYAKNPLGKLVLSLPNALQEPAFMGIQYGYALFTMLPCPIWFWYRWASATFLMTVFTWATYNGATFYIDVFGKRMEKELEALKKEVNKWQTTPEGGRPARDREETADGGNNKTPSSRATKPAANVVTLPDRNEGSTAKDESTQAVRRN